MIVLISTIFKENETKVFLMKMFILELPSDCNVPLRNHPSNVHQTADCQIRRFLFVFPALHIKLFSTQITIEQQSLAR